jgi:hypothetical protein
MVRVLVLAAWWSPAPPAARRTTPRVAGAFTIITLARVTALDGLAGGQIIWNTIVMPTAERDQLVFGVYMPIHDPTRS